MNRLTDLDDLDPIPTWFDDDGCEHLYLECHCGEQVDPADPRHQSCRFIP